MGVSERRTIEIAVFDITEYDSGWPPEHLPSFMVWLEEQVGKIPEECRSSARIQISGSQDDYESSCRGNIVINYSRPENDDEYARRCEKEIDQRVQEAYRLKQQIASAQARLEELK